MHKDNRNERLKAEELLNVYSVDTIIELFQDINKRISLLIDSSAEDFKHLHVSFIKTHESITQITADASDIIYSFSDEDNIRYVNEVKHEIGELKKWVHDLTKVIKANQKFHEEISRNLDHLYIPINNYNQNLKTFKLLSANLKLDSTTLNYSNELNSVIENIIIRFPDLVKSLKNLRVIQDESRKTLETIETNYLRSVFESFDYIMSFGQFLLQKHHLAQKFKIKLKEKVELSNDNISKIITHLQYQDIVRQKIEHIQQTHNDILDKLSRLINKNDHPDTELSKAKLLIQIRDIAGLQAAQLIHANSEYQNAIEVITTKFIELGEVLEDISSMCKQFCIVDNTDNMFFQTDPEIASTKSSVLSNEVDAIFNILILKIENICNFIHAFSNSYNELKGCGFVLSQLVEKIRQDSILSDTSNSVKIINQIQEVSKEFLKTIEQIDTYSSENAVLAQKLWNYTDNHLIQENKKQNVKNRTKNLVNITKDFSRQRSGLFHKFYSRIEHCVIANDLKDSIEKVKYYELFEKEIEQIILNLDTISKKLHIEDEKLSKDTKNTLESLKKRYTVKSEYLVHEQISNEAQKGNTDFFEAGSNISVSKDTTNEDDDNLELF